MYWLFTYIFLAIYRVRYVDNIYIYVYTLYMSNIFFIRKTRLVGDLAVLVLSVFFYGAYSGLGSSL